MSNNEFQSQTQESSFIDENNYDREPGEIRESNGTTPSPPRLNQRLRTQPTFTDNASSIFNDEHTERRIRLESLVSKYCDRRKTKSITIKDIQKELDREPPLSVEEKESTLRLCIEEINSVEARVKHGSTTSRRRKASERQIIAGSSSSSKSTHRKQSESGSISEIDDDEPKKKLRLKEDMPWFRRDIVDIPSTNPSCVKTVKSLRLFNRDMKSCKFLVSITAGSPDNIPPTQWERIFKGESVDLDQILSSLHRVTVTEEQKARIGETILYLDQLK